MRKFAWLFALALFLAACGGSGTPPGGNACPDPAVFDNAACTFDDAGTLFGP
ncbi:ABC-type branched-chain amino acid transport systems periplasmic component-like protein [Oceanithermus profundus DSM 14977]|uniref:ABC-type branched-chain amino acid transport systems periplasmic component-like protein n=1 Tax=Oceanithermus profundus (strain DSM 14977 / NBRC 100410 / VKM B-2274 / 506) TaxID=670487 RepID=E4UAC6_OCEP5|nr:hypothetical protein [Oceanithermus profundus]ADR37631.1 ABC-type branched-chain amino acid transport systems periplasmic component-like protein [Oceanithermus profundus DSM 14977]